MIFRLLVWIVLLLGLSYLTKKLIRGLGGDAGGRVGPGQGASRGTVPPQSAGVMVRDPVCNTYLPADRALTHRTDGGETLHFCSEECRGKFLSGRSRSVS